MAELSKEKLLSIYERMRLIRDLRRHQRVSVTVASHPCAETEAGESISR